ncbi:MAG: acetyl-CoA carboxylase biotin carboxylase subunit [Xanthobacteraceae bacterium]
MVQPFGKLLIANRGEIACRIMRTAMRMGITTVAIYSDADRGAMHVALADEAVRIGPPPARDSYLRIDAVIEAARQTGAEAIHPGYGFLSENADFAEACEAAGIVFVGPSAKTIRLMGSKSAAKALMESASVPIVPGYHGEGQDIATLGVAADRIGYPVLVKASAGGGGRGMRVVASAGELADAVAGAKRESLSAFGDDRLLIEKYVARPRHIEVQVFGDSHGSVVSLFERECTLQRRHQKVIEEAPAIDLAAERREAMSAAARAAAQAVGYVNAGTVEFITDAERFYFIEMNTRLQVEHPVTEMITGLDLVEWQLRVAAGEKLPLAQNAITANGHAVEARIYAENPAKGFLPATGKIARWRAPEGEGIRVDTGFRQGDTVTPYYDALLAKLIAWAPERATALDRLGRALRDFAIAGVTTNICFLRALVDHPQVRAGTIDTGLIERELAVLTAMPPLSRLDLAAAAAAVLLREVILSPFVPAQAGTQYRAVGVWESGSPPSRGRTEEIDALASPWDRRDGWMIAGARTRRLSFRHGDERVSVVLRYGRDGVTLMSEGAGASLRYAPRAGDAFEVTLGAKTETVNASWHGRDLALATPRGPIDLHWIDPFAAELGEVEGAGRIVAPMPGTVTRVLVEAGTDVARGTPLIVLEAMKMEHTLRAPADGRLAALKCAVGDFVQEGTELAEFEPSAEA